MNLKVIGKQFIGGARIAEGVQSLKSLNATTGETYPITFYQATENEVALAAKAAAQAYVEFRQTTLLERAKFLEEIASEIDSISEQFLSEVSRETGLSSVRLHGERSRTTNQLRLFASVIRRGDFLGARIDTAMPERNPLPRLDIRQSKLAIGPVAVFGASNFPLAFSVAGGDTASALAAGCPVVVKAHSAHLVTSEVISQAIEKAILSSGMPAGTFNLVYGDTVVGKELVLHSEIKAVGFTGSLNGGRALFDLATSRPEPIPVFAEMSSINPLVLLDGALENQVEEIAKGAVSSVVGSCGQLCTKPGLFIGVKSDSLTLFKEKLMKEFSNQSAQVMLTQGIMDSYSEDIEALKKHNEIECLAEGSKESNKATAYLFKASPELLFCETKILEKEIFGPASVLVELDDWDQLVLFIKRMQGQLTFTFHATDEELERNKSLLFLAEEKVGRVLINGFPTGVEVCDSMVHGGAYPATTDSRGTSVGTLALERFLRPVCYQSYPDKLLPEALKNANPLGITRLVNGELSNKKIIN